MRRLTCAMVLVAGWGCEGEAEAERETVVVYCRGGGGPCGQPIHETGFECPPELPYEQVIAQLRICSEAPLTEAEVDDILEQVRAHGGEGHMTLDGQPEPDAAVDAQPERELDAAAASDLAVDAASEEADSTRDAVEVEADAAIDARAEWPCRSGWIPVEERGTCAPGPEAGPARFRARCDRVPYPAPAACPERGQPVGGICPGLLGCRVEGWADDGLGCLPPSGACGEAEGGRLFPSGECRVLRPAQGWDGGAADLRGRDLGAVVLDGPELAIEGARFEALSLSGETLSLRDLIIEGDLTIIATGNVALERVVVRGDLRLRVEGRISLRASALGAEGAEGSVWADTVRLEDLRLSGRMSFGGATLRALGVSGDLGAVAFDGGQVDVVRTRVRGWMQVLGNYDLRDVDVDAGETRAPALVAWPSGTLARVNVRGQIGPEVFGVHGSDLRIDASDTALRFDGSLERVEVVGGGIIRPEGVAPDLPRLADLRWSAGERAFRTGIMKELPGLVLERAAMSDCRPCVSAPSALIRGLRAATSGQALDVRHAEVHDLILQGGAQLRAEGTLRAACVQTEGACDAPPQETVISIADGARVELSSLALNAPAVAVRVEAGAEARIEQATIIGCPGGESTGVEVTGALLELEEVGLYDLDRGVVSEGGQVEAAGLDVEADEVALAIDGVFELSDSRLSSREVAARVAGALSVARTWIVSGRVELEEGGHIDGAFRGGDQE